MFFALVVFPKRINCFSVWFYCFKGDHSASLFLTSQKVDINFSLNVFFATITFYRAIYTCSYKLKSYIVGLKCS